MTDEEYVCKFKDYQINPNNYKRKYESILKNIFYFFCFYTIISSILCLNLYPENKNIKLLLTPLPIMFFLIVIAELYSRKVDKYIIEFRNHIYKGKLSDIFDIEEPVLSKYKKHFIDCIKKEKGLPSLLLIEINKDIIESNSIENLEIKIKNEIIINEIKSIKDI